MKTKLSNFTSIYSQFAKRKKLDLLTGLLLFTVGIIVCYPGFSHLVISLARDGISMMSLNSVFADISDSVLLILPSLLFFSIGYLLLESHSWGWKLAGVSSLASLVFVAIGHPNSDILTVAAFTAGLSGLATALQIQSRRKTENLTNMPTTTENIAKFGLVLSGIVSVTVLIGMIVYTGVRASPYLSWTFLTSTSWSWTQAAQVVGGNAPSSSMGGVMGMTIGSLFLVGFCELIAIPLGLGAAIYLSEYASQNIVTGIVRFFIETLAGIPSVIIALVGFGFFVAGTMHWGFSLFAGGLSLAFMILPWNIRIAEESMRSVPGTYREAAYALGATQWQTVRGAVLFAAFPGIITGILLGVGAALGETIVVAMTAGEPSPNFGFASHIFSIGQNIPSLPVFIWRAPLDINVRAGSASASTNVVFNTYGIALAGAFVLIIIYLAICALALVARNVLNKKIKGV